MSKLDEYFLHLLCFNAAHFESIFYGRLPAEDAKVDESLASHVSRTEVRNAEIIFADAADGRSRDFLEGGQLAVRCSSGPSGLRRVT